MKIELWLLTAFALSGLCFPLRAAADAMAVTGLGNLNLGTYSGGGSDMDGSDTFCVYHSDGPLYTVEASGPNSGGSFYMSAAGKTLKYSIWYRDHPSSGEYYELEPGTPRNYGNARQDPESCSGDTNPTASVKAVVRNSDLQAATGGLSYSAVLSLIFTPRH